MKYSLRNLFLAIFILALILGVGIPAFERLTFDPVANAVAQLQRHDPKFVKFYHNNEWKGDYFAIDLTGAELSDGDLSYVRTINPMGEIILADSNVTDDNLWELYGANCCRIDLSGTEVSDVGIKKLRTAVRYDCEIVKTSASTSKSNN